MAESNGKKKKKKHKQLKGVDNVSTGASHAGIFTVHSAGSQISKWDSGKYGPLIFSPKKAVYEVGSSPHGGVPICFPWFGNPPAPVQDDEVPYLGNPSSNYKHGFARLVNWKKTEEFDSEKTWGVTYRLTDKDVPKTLASTQPFEAKFEAEFSALALTMTFKVKNTGVEPFKFESALHTYFKVQDVREVEVAGLDGVSYVDTADPDQPTLVQNGPVTFEGLVDRVYQGELSPSVIDRSAGRQINVETEKSRTTVVWNPGPDHVAALGDVSDSEAKRFVCVESGNARENAVLLKPGEKHKMTVTYRVERV